MATDDHSPDGSLSADPSQPGGTPSNGFNTTVIQDTTRFIWSGTLSAGTTYYWAVHALGNTQYGTWSNANSFTTNQQPTGLLRSFRQR